jgi:hypothetical protein
MSTGEGGRGSKARDPGDKGLCFIWTMLEAEKGKFWPGLCLKMVSLRTRWEHKMGFYLATSGCVHTQEKSADLGITVLCPEHCPCLLPGYLSLSDLRINGISVKSLPWSPPTAVWSGIAHSLRFHSPMSSPTLVLTQWPVLLHPDISYSRSSLML